MKHAITVRTANRNSCTAAAHSDDQRVRSVGPGPRCARRPGQRRCRRVAPHKNQPPSSRRSVVGRTQHPQMAPPRDLHRVGRTCSTAPGLGRPLLRTRRLTHGVGKRFQVVPARTGRSRAVQQPYDLPPTRGGQALRVLGAQVVAVGFGVGGERAEDRGRVGVDVRQRRYGGTAASGARTATYRAHDVGRYRTLERAATTLPQVTPPCRVVKHPTRPFHLKPLTCAGTFLQDPTPLRNRSPLGTNHINNLELTGLGEIRKRAQPWLEWSSADMPCRRVEVTRTTPLGSAMRPARGLPFTSDGHPCTAPCRRPRAPPP